MSSSTIEKNLFLKKKFANEQELQFKITGRRNKYFGEWVAENSTKKVKKLKIMLMRL